MTASVAAAPAPERSAVRLPPAFTADADAELADVGSAHTRRDPRGPRTEAEYLVELRALLGSDPDAFARRAESVLLGAGPACEQFASLRAAYEAGWPGTNDLCARTATARNREADPRAESVSQALVHWLGERAPREVRAREALAEIVWSSTARARTVDRVRALRALVLGSPEEDVRALALRIYAESDPDVHSAGESVLDERDRPAAHSEAFQESP